jgi:hypothetical protein
MARVLRAVRISVAVFATLLLALLLTGTAGGVEIWLAASLSAVVGFPFARPSDGPRPSDDE